MTSRNIAAVLAVSVALAAALAAQEPGPTFEVASIKPQARPMTARDLSTANPRARAGGLFTATHATVESLILFAYDLQGFQLTGGPDWTRSDPYEVTARAAGDVPIEEMRRLVHSLLRDRFRLVTRMEQRDMAVFSLVRARTDGPPAPYLRPVEGDCDTAKASEVVKTFPPRAETAPGAMMSGRCTDIAGLAGMLSAIAGRGGGPVDRPVIDRTGLGGKFVYEMRYAPASPQAAAPAAADPALPPFTAALEEQLGLKLEPARGPVDVLVIDSVERPSEN